MDKTLELKLKELEKSLKTLGEVLTKKKSDIIRDSTIKRFEYAFELCWKVNKLFLREREGLDTFSPKDCFRKLRNVGLISDEETEDILRMSDDRNEIIHTYNEDFADELYHKISHQYYKLMKKIYDRIKGALFNK